MTVTGVHNVTFVIVETDSGDEYKVSNSSRTVSHWNDETQEWEFTGANKIGDATYMEIIEAAEARFAELANLNK